MEKFFKEVKSLRSINKWRHLYGEDLASSRSSSPGLDEQEEEEEEEEQEKEEDDTLLWVEDEVTYWRPKSPYSLGSDEEEYVPIHHMVLAVPQAAEADAEGGWSLQPSNLNEHHHTSLQVMVPGYPLKGVLFLSPQHPHEGQETLQLDFPAAIDYLRNVFETGIHLLEVIEDKTHITTRFIVGSWKDPCMPDLPLYTPRKPGGPLFRDIDGNYSFLETVRSYQSKYRLPHDLEFIFCISSNQMSHLGTLCSEREDPADE